MGVRLGFAYVAAVAQFWIAPASAGSYVYQHVAYPGARQTTPTGIDDAGDVVGTYYTGTGRFGFIFSKGNYTSINLSGKNKKFEFDAVSANGVATGRYQPEGAPAEIAFTYDLASGQITNLPMFPSAVSPFPSAISPKGVVVGTAFDANNDEYGFKSTSRKSRLLPTPPGTEPSSTEVYLTAVNRQGVAAGFYLTNGSTIQGFLFSSGRYELVTVPGETGTYVEAVRDDGAIAGEYIDPNVPVGSGSFMPGFVRFGTTYQTFAPPGSQQTFTVGLDEAGQVLGTYNDKQAVDHGFIWQNGTVASLDMPGSAMTQISAINSRGDFVGLSARANERQSRGFVAKCFSAPCTR